MAKTVLELTPEEKEAYRPLDAIKQHRQSNRYHVEERWQKAQQLARQVAKILREEFGASRVLLFGSADNYYLDRDSVCRF